MQVISATLGVMLGRTYENQVCSAARALEIAGERWSLLILRNAAFAGMTRFSEFQKSLEIAPNILAARLAHFVESGLMETSDEGDGRETYHLTKKGLDFVPVIIALTKWGDRWAAPDGVPIVYEHGCGGRMTHVLQCTKCGETVQPGAVTARKTAVMAKLQAQRKARVLRPRGVARERRGAAASTDAGLYVRSAPPPT
jgi:DNA-binding HxlR family transcriptional regulator